MNLWTAFGAINAFVAVACGAFGAHGLRDQLTPGMLAVFETGVRYHMYHALGLIAVGWLVNERGPSAHLAGWFMLAGIALFSGSLYAMALTSMRALGAITPFGGLSFLIAWGIFAWVAARG